MKDEALTIVASLCADGVLDKKEEAILRKALAHPEQGMTLDQLIDHVGGGKNAAGFLEFNSVKDVETLIGYVLRDTTPPQRTWVELTNEDCLEALKALDPETKKLPLAVYMFANNIQAKLKEKNT